MRRTCLLIIVLLAVCAGYVFATTPTWLPPPEAWEESPKLKAWQITAIEIHEDGETAIIRLQRRDKPHVVAVAVYRLVSMTITEKRSRGTRAPASGEP